jgi:peptidyl-prolyl cis-trans isomerase SurA
VNGKDITAAELERQFRARTGTEAANSDDADDAKLQILSQIISDEILLGIAAKEQIGATDSEVEAKFNAFRSQYSEEALNGLLAQQKTTIEEMKVDIRRSLTLDKLVNKEVTSKIRVSDAEVTEFYNKNKKRFDLPEGFHIAHILVTAFPDADIKNAKKDDAKTSDEARQKVIRLLKEAQSGDFAAVARDYSEDPTSALQGGDLGFQTFEAIANIDARLGQVVQKMKPGDIHPQAVETRFGYHIVKLMEREPGGQKDLSDPRVQSRIHQELFNRKDRALKAALADVSRNQAEVSNYLAERILAAAAAGKTD